MLEHRDSLWLDMTAGTKYPMRKNGYEIINKKDGGDTLKEADKGDIFQTESSKINIKKKNQIKFI
jgi:hypothetical protein